MLVQCKVPFGSRPDCPKSECAEYQMVKSSDFGVIRISDGQNSDVHCTQLQFKLQIISAFFVFPS